MSLHSWNCPRTGLEQPGMEEGAPAGTGWSLKSLPTQIIPEFWVWGFAMPGVCEQLHHKNRSFLGLEVAHKVWRVATTANKIDNFLQISFLLFYFLSKCGLFQVTSFLLSPVWINFKTNSNPVTFSREAELRDLLNFFGDYWEILIRIWLEMHQSFLEFSE